jgi:hypothetical protein
MDEANAGEGGGTGGGGGEVGNAQESQAPAGTVMGAGATEQVAAPSIPEKYQVKKEDGTLDIEASSLKLAEAYGHLEKRMGSGDAPPKSAAEYKIEIPEALKDTWNPAEDKPLQDFLTAAHAKGFTQGQIDLALSTYHAVAPGLLQGNAQLSVEECTAELRNTWKTDAEFKEGVDLSYKAAVAYAGEDAEALMNKYGNDPLLIKTFARVGKELGEDRSINPGSELPAGTSVEALQLSEAYSNPKHPDHARVSKQVADHYAKKAEIAARSGHVPLM